VHAVYTSTFVLQVMCDTVCPAGCDVEDYRREVDISIQRLFYWEAYVNVM